jgi:hypothetical protein
MRAVTSSRLGSGALADHATGHRQLRNIVNSVK